jgi:hypothetical protein
MTTKSFVVNGYRDLQVLQRVFREAKFCNEANDDEVSASPIVADLYLRLVDVLIEADVAEFGEHVRVNWANWLQMDPSRDEWNSAMRRACSEEKWLAWTFEERLSHTRLLLSPFVISSELELQFINEVTTHIAAHPLTRDLEED